MTANTSRTLPHLLVLQVGIVVAQPSAVLPHLAHHIRREAHGHQQEVALHPLHQRVAAHAHANGREDDERRRDEPRYPERPFAVLQHAEQHNDGCRDGEQTVEQRADEHPQRGRIAIGHHGSRQVPQMACRQDSEIHGRPPAQSFGRRYVPRKGVAPAQQKIHTSHRRHRSPHGIQHQQQDDIESDMFEHYRLKL